MRFSTSAATFVLTSLLVKDVVAVPQRHSHKHTRTYGPTTSATPEVTVQEETIETVTSWVYVTVEWPGPTESSSSVESTSTTSSTSTLVSTIIVVPTPTSVAPVAAVSTAAVSVAAVSIAQVQEEAAKPTTTAAPAVVTVAAAKPTTLATVVKPSSVVAAVVAQTSAAAAAVATVASSSSSTSSGKRGLAYNSAALCNAFLSSSKVTWAYNWASSSSGLSSGVEFVPLLWGLESDKTTNWVTNANAAIAAGSTHLMCFNEPDLPAQANLGYAAAAAGFLKYMQPYAGKAKLGAPAVTNGGSPMGLTYLKNFLSSCSTCTIDFVSIHWYDSASNVAYFKSYVADAYAAGGNRPLWITEFGASGSAAEQATFLATVLPWLDAQSYVARYAYFMVSDGSLVSGSALSTIGAAYVNS